MYRNQQYGHQRPQQFGGRQQQGYQQQRGYQPQPPQHRGPQPPQRPQRDPNDFLMGGGVASATFHNIGDTCVGTIVEPPTVQQQRDMDSGELKFWDNGDPMEQLVITLQTDQRDPQIQDDDGRRRLYVKYNMREAVRDAVRKSGAKGLEVGGVLRVTFTSEGEPTRRGMNPPKFYEAQYQPRAGNFLNAQDNGQQPGGPANPLHAQGSNYTEVYNTFVQRIREYMQQVPADQTYNDQQMVGNVFRKLMGSMFPGRAPSTITPAEWDTARTAMAENFLPDQQDFDFNLQPQQPQPSQQQMFVNQQGQQFTDADIPF